MQSGALVGWRTRRHALHLLWHGAMLSICLVVFFPFFWMLSMSLKTLAEALSVPPSALPRHPDLSNYLAAWHAAPFARYYANSFLVASATAAATVVTASLAGYGLVRGDFPGRRVLLLLVLASVMIPFEATFIPNFVLITRLHWYDTFAALIIPWTTSAFSIFLFRQAYLAIPADIYEAALMDGCTEGRIFRSVAFPLSRAAVVTVFLLSYLWSWNALLWPILVTSSADMRVVQLGLFQFQTEGGVYVNLLMAAVALSILPIIVIFLLSQRLLVEGISKGAIR